MKTLSIVTHLATLSLLLAGCASNQTRPSATLSSANDVVVHIEGAREGVEYEIRHLIGAYKGHSMAVCNDVSCSANLGSLLSYGSAETPSSTLTFKHTLPLPPFDAEKLPPQEEWEITLHWAGKAIPLKCATWQALPVVVGKTGQLIAVTCFGQL